MNKRFEKTLNVLLHYADKVGDFRGIAEDFKTLIEENEQFREQVEKQNKAIAELTALLAVPTVVEEGK